MFTTVLVSPCKLLPRVNRWRFASLVPGTVSAFKACEITRSYSSGVWASSPWKATIPFPASPAPHKTLLCKQSIRYVRNCQNLICQRPGKIRWVALFPGARQPTQPASGNMILINTISSNCVHCLAGLKLNKNRSPLLVHELSWVCTGQREEWLTALVTRWSSFFALLGCCLNWKREQISNGFTESLIWWCKFSFFLCWLALVVSKLCAISRG